MLPAKGERKQHQLRAVGCVGGSLSLLLVRSKFLRIRALAGLLLVA
jgi:hypothetical protein